MRDDDALARGARALRAEPETGWQAIEARILAAVRSTPRGGWPIGVDDPSPDGPAGRVLVSDKVLGTLLSRSLSGDPDYTVTHIGIDSDDTVVQRISIELAGRYMADIPAAVHRVIASCRAVVTEVIGDRPDLRIDVELSDVHR